MADSHGWLIHYEWLRALAQRTRAGEDIAQEVMVDVITRAPEVDNPRAFLAQALRFQSQRRVRSEQRRRRREAAAERDEPRSVEAELLTRERIERVLGGLGQLAPADREVLLQHYAEGLSTREIATRKDMPAGTVRWRLKVARDRLAEKLRCGAFVFLTRGLLMKKTISIIAAVVALLLGLYAAHEGADEAPPVELPSAKHMPAPTRVGKAAAAVTISTDDEPAVGPLSLPSPRRPDPATKLERVLASVSAEVGELTDACEADLGPASFGVRAIARGVDDATFVEDVVLDAVSSEGEANTCVASSLYGLDTAWLEPNEWSQITATRGLTRRDSIRTYANSLLAMLPELSEGQRRSLLGQITPWHAALYLETLDELERTELWDALDADAREAALVAIDTLDAETLEGPSGAMTQLVVY